MWEGRFKSSLVHEDNYCLACYRYIELNPVRAGMVRHPANYAWSSFRINAMADRGLYITPHTTWLQLGQNNADRTRAYLRLFDTVLSQHKINDIRYGVRKGLPVGNRLFKKEIELALSVKLGDGKRGRPRKNNA
jgi:putative transposase